MQQVSRQLCTKISKLTFRSGTLLSPKAHFASTSLVSLSKDGKPIYMATWISAWTGVRRVQKGCAHNLPCNKGIKEFTHLTNCILLYNLQLQTINLYTIPFKNCHYETVVTEVHWELTEYLILQ